MQPRNVNYVSRISTLVDADKILDRECFEGLSWMVGGLERMRRRKKEITRNIYVKDSQDYPVIFGPSYFIYYDR